MKKLALLLAGALLCAQTESDRPIVINTPDAKFRHDSDDPPGGESLMVRMDRKTGAMEFFARYPAGYSFKPHAHKANERFMVLEGKMTIDSGGSKTTLDPGGFAYFPAGQTHSIACVSTVKCMWYLAWDGKP